MAQIELTVPDLGGFSDIPVIEVLIHPGEAVAKDAPLVTLESDKATMEVPASAAGTVREIKVKVGDKVSQGTVLATVDAADGVTLSPSTGERPTPPPVQPTPVPAQPMIQPTATTDAAPPAETIERPPVSTAPTAPAKQSVSTNGASVHASPAIRRFARELGVDLSRVRGSGPNGRITREDVQAYVKSALVAPPSAPSAGAVSGFGLGLPPWPSVDFAKFGPIERVALPRIQKISGPALARNWVMIPHVTQNDDADVTDLEAFRKQINGERKDVKVTMLAFLMKAAIAALKAYPQVNASLDGAELGLKRYYNIGFAADTPNGLVVPVVKNADKKGVLEIAAESAALAGKARDGKLGLADMQGGTFSITNGGIFGSLLSTPILNPPQSAILGMHAIQKRPVAVDDQVVIGPMMYLALSDDHRLIDGREAGSFLVRSKECLESPERLLLEI